MSKSEHHKNWVHGKEPQRLYYAWSNMRKRCYQKQNAKYKSYGGRGVKVCSEWLHSFPAFRDWAIANGYKDNLTIDRIDTNGDYEPSNCRWVTQKIQQNNRRNNHPIEFNGETHTMAEWAEITGIPYHTIKYRVKRGLPSHLVLFKERGVGFERAYNSRLDTP